MQSIKQCFSLLSTVIATDFISRIAMDLIPQEFKETYIEPGFDYVYGYISETLEQIVNLPNNFAFDFGDEL